MKSALLKSRVVILLFALFSTLRILDSIISWPLQPRPPPASTSLTSSSLFASMRFSRASPLISFLITSVRKLPSVQSRDLLDCQCLTVLLALPDDIGVVKVLHENQGLRARGFLQLSEEGPCLLIPDQEVCNRCPQQWDHSHLAYHQSQSRAPCIPSALSHKGQLTLLTIPSCPS